MGRCEGQRPSPFVGKEKRFSLIEEMHRGRGLAGMRTFKILVRKF